MNRVPSLSALTEAFPQSTVESLSLFREKAKSLPWEKAKAYADSAIQGHGVESIRCPRRGLLAVYVNTGDTYSPTLLCNIATGAWRLTTWGDYVEAFERRHGRASGAVVLSILPRLRRCRAVDPAAPPALSCCRS